MKLVMSTRALIGLRPMELSRRCSQSGDGPLRTPRTSRSAKAGQSFRSASAKASVTRTGQGRARVRAARRPAFSRPKPGAARVAGDAVHGRAVRPVRRQADLDHGVREPGIGCVGLPHGRVGLQVDDALVVVRQAELEGETSMPRLSTPRMVPMPKVAFLPGRKVPGGAKALFMPARALGAPQTT
jgi:hypothetical protein